MSTAHQVWQRRALSPKHSLSLASYLNIDNEGQNDQEASKSISINENNKTSEQSIQDTPLEKHTRAFFKLLSRNKDKEHGKKNLYAIMVVIDQGAGIPVDKREDIFSPFVRLKQEKKGSGLGLSLVAQIAEAHGGSISTDTWQGKTRFLVVLPINQDN